MSDQTQAKAEQDLFAYISELPVHHLAARQYRELITLVWQMKMQLDSSEIELPKKYQTIFRSLIL